MEVLKGYRKGGVWEREMWEERVRRRQRKNDDGK
jgi:hypothetical protein